MALICNLWFDIIPEDINILIMYNLEAGSLTSFMKSSHKLYNLMYKDDLYNIYIYIKVCIPDLYKFINNVRNIDSPLTWKEVYQDYFNIKNLIEKGIKVVRASEIIYSYFVSLSYPELYEQLKDIDLNKSGYIYNSCCKWEDLFVVLVLERDEFGKFKYLRGNYDDTEDFNKLVRSLMSGSHAGVIFVMYYIKVKNSIKSNGPFSKLNLLSRYFMDNTDMYEYLLKSLNLQEFTNDILLSFKLTQYIGEIHVDIMINDIIEKKKLQLINS